MDKSCIRGQQTDRHPETENHPVVTKNSTDSTQVKNRWNISIGIPLNLSISTEMGYIQPLVENKNSAKLCFSYLC